MLGGSFDFEQFECAIPILKSKFLTTLFSKNWFWPTDTKVFEYLPVRQQNYLNQKRTVLCKYIVLCIRFVVCCLSCLSFGFVFQVLCMEWCALLGNCEGIGGLISFKFDIFLCLNRVLAFCLFWVFDFLFCVYVRCMEWCAVLGNCGGRGLEGGL